MLEHRICLLITTVFFLPLVQTSHHNVTEFDDSSPDGGSVHEVVLRIIRTCFEDTNRLITLSGNVSRKLAETIHKSELTAVIIISTEAPSIDEAYAIAKQSRFIYIQGLYFRLIYKAKGFILAAASQQTLRRQIEELKNTRWWKASGLLIVIDDGTTAINSCKNAQTFMWLAWRCNMLSSVFVCHDANKKLMIYSYNPYNNMVPKNWLRVGELHGRAGHPWVLYKRNATQALGDCSEIFYDKTKTLDGYEVRSNAEYLKPQLMIDHSKTGLEKYSGEDGNTIRTIFQFLNASIKDVPYTGDDPIGYFDANGTFYGMLGDLSSGKADIGLNARYMIHVWKLGMSRPHTVTDVCLLVKSRGNVPQWMNLLFAFDLWTILGLVTVILLTTVVLSYYSTVSAGCMNGLRLLISTSLTRLPSRVPVRLILINVFALFLIANSIFQGRMTSLLMKPRAYHNPETQTELGIEEYTVYGYPPFGQFIDDPVLQSRFVPTQSWDCYKGLTSAGNIACILECKTIYNNIEDLSELHVVPERLQIFHSVFLVSEDWPLLDRFDQLLLRLLEAGFLSYWKNQDTQIWLAHDYKTRLSRVNNSPFLSLVDLAFIFYWLLLSLLFASLVFSYEVLSVRYRVGFRRILTLKRN